MNKDAKKQNPFPVIDDQSLILENHTDDSHFFEEAFSEKRTQNNHANKTFLGSIIKQKRYKYAGFFVCFCFSVFLLRAGFFQIYQGNHYRVLAEENRILHKTLPSQRGIIYDKNGIILAENIPTFQLVIPTNILLGDQYTQQLEDIAKKIDLNIDEVKEEYRESEQESVLLDSNLSYEQALYYLSKNQDYPWLSIETNSLRSYITDEIPSLSHILGYTASMSPGEYEKWRAFGYRSFDQIGKQGLEKYYEQQLRGLYGEELLEVDALGSIERIISKTEAQNGQNLHTTLDSELQKSIEIILDSRMQGTGSSKASVVVMNPNDGSIMSLVSWPAYDANDFAKGIDEASYLELINNKDNPLYPRAISGEFPSGSTIKPVFAAAALIEEIINPYTTFVSTGGIWVSIWFFPDWKSGGHGLTDVYHAIADSVNTFFYYIGGGSEQFEGLGLDTMMQYAALFGFGQQTDIDLPGEADGFLPSKKWKEETKGEQWYIGDTYHVAIGQGDLLVTPLQIAQATAVFANGGSLVTPHLNAQIQIETTPVIDTETAQIIQDAMRQTVTAGSGTALQAAPVATAGKTGTAQWSTQGVPHSWFTGFAPYENPEVVVTVLIEEGGGDYYIAVPVVLDILHEIYPEQ